MRNNNHTAIPVLLSVGLLLILLSFAIHSIATRNSFTSVEMLEPDWRERYVRPIAASETYSPYQSRFHKLYIDDLASRLEQGLNLRRSSELDILAQACALEMSVEGFDDFERDGQYHGLLRARAFSHARHLKAWGWGDTILTEPESVLVFNLKTGKAGTQLIEVVKRRPIYGLGIYSDPKFPNQCCVYLLFTNDDLFVSPFAEGNLQETGNLELAMDSWLSKYLNKAIEQTESSPQLTHLYLLVNEERQKADLKPLKYNKNLATLALATAATVGEEHHYSHVTLSGLGPFERLLVSQPGFGSRSLENLFVGSHVQQVHDAFMNSNQHRTNILNPDHKQVGIASYTDIDGNTYWVELFGEVYP